MNDGDFEWAVDSSKKTLLELEQLRVTKKTLARFVQGGQVIHCIECDTYNLCEVESIEETLEYFKKKKVNLKEYGKNFEIFHCNNCEDYAIRYRDKN